MAEETESGGLLQSVGEAVGGFLAGIPPAINSLFAGIGEGAGVHVSGAFLEQRGLDPRR